VFHDGVLHVVGESPRGAVVKSQNSTIGLTGEKAFQASNDVALRPTAPMIAVITELHARSPFVVPPRCL
jgi:hypothetical protein